MFVQLLRKIIPLAWRPTRYLEALTRDRTGSRVRTGPFAGMRYIRTLPGSTLVSKLLGIYEKELGASIEVACVLQPDTIINVGAGEGYYAVGLALRNPAARVIAFEMDEVESKMLAEMIEINEVTNRVEVRGKCEPADLQTVIAGASRPLVLCDVESYELVLLDPTAVPGLRGAHILVELHDFLHRGLAETIEGRFTATHRLARIWQTERLGAEFPYSTLYTRLLPKSYLDLAVNERRVERMSWFWMEPLQ